MLSYSYRNCKQLFRGNKTLKKSIATILLASFILTNFSSVACFAVGENNNAKKISISKSHKQRAKSDEFKYDYINYKWWDNFNDPLLTGYIDKAIKNNYDLKMATNAVDEFYQAIRINFANQLPTATVGFNTAYAKLPGQSADFNFVTPTFASYELDLFLKNRDKTSMSKKDYEASLQDERAAYIGIASAVGATYSKSPLLSQSITPHCPSVTLPPLATISPFSTIVSRSGSTSSFFSTKNGLNCLFFRFSIVFCTNSIFTDIFFSFVCINLIVKICNKCYDYDICKK
jgi:hypothetical protein